MGYTWKSIADGDYVSIEEWNEIKTNIDKLYRDRNPDGLNLPDKYSWLHFPVKEYHVIGYKFPKELRDAVDYADGQNYCRSDMTANLVTDYESENVSHDIDNDVIYHDIYYGAEYYIARCNLFSRGCNYCGDD